MDNLDCSYQNQGNCAF